MDDNEHPTLSSSLLEDVRQMDPHGWSRLVTTFGPIVYRWCRASRVPENDAADLVQEVFTSVARGINGFQRQKESGSFRCWLATITRNRVRDYIRAQSEREAGAGGTAALQRLQQEPEVSLESTICAESALSPLTRRIVAEVRSEFEDKTWSAFWLTAVEGRPASEAADVCGLSVASVYQAKSRVLRRLRRRLSEVPE